MRIRFKTKADRIVEAEEQEKKDRWDRFFAILPREIKSGEWAFLCWLERCPRVIKKIDPNLVNRAYKVIQWRYRAPMGK
ncbi:hypothetical protein CPT_Maja_060 [Burkholderia phage Maja]|uniref:Uncharacterized protein n=1 Tax=Burkholderia phage Maja TaxID=2767571 RepID=A0A7S6R794_9CAUD|nr:hypothetical protein CPT_Maja_060 [Burkholderia phage Maja]